MRERAERLVVAQRIRGRTDPPPALEGWITATFGSVESVREQEIVRVTNPATLESTIFAPLRARRPIDGDGDDDEATAELEAQLARTDGDPFCTPETGTPADMFGRVTGRHVTTGANAALAEAHHAVLVFDRHDPLAFDAELIADVLRTGRSWADRVREDDPDATNYLLIWNCLWRAGGSIVHGHAQALIGSGDHYEQLVRLRRDATSYAERHGTDLIEDRLAVHRSLGLVIEMGAGVSLVATLTPRKERELVLIGSIGMDEADPAFADALGRVLKAYRDHLDVRSFNLAIWRPPLGDTPGWEWMPPMARVVDRGDLRARPSDIGAMELYATPVVSSDPFAVIERLR